MIVNCPSCTTLYRFEPPAGVLAVLARCSGCDSHFEMEPHRHAYAVLDDVPMAVAAPPAAADVARGEAEPWTPPDGMKLGTFDYDPEAEAAEAAANPAPPARKAAVGEWLTALFLGTVGAGSGYYLALLQEAEMTTFIAGGSAIGLVLGWAVIRWMAREP